MNPFFCQFSIDWNAGAILDLGPRGGTIKCNALDTTNEDQKVSKLHGIVKAFNLRCLTPESSLTKCELWIGSVPWIVYYPNLDGYISQSIEFSFFDSQGFPIDMLYHDRFELFVTGHGAFELTALTTPYRGLYHNLWTGRLSNGLLYNVSNGHGTIQYVECSEERIMVQSDEPPIEVDDDDTNDQYYDSE